MFAAVLASVKGLTEVPSVLARARAGGEELPHET